MSRTKVIAYYLPQFHEIEENNKWWGKGFTEWVNVKKGFPLYEGHYQPKVPLKERYYDLSNVSVIEEQAKLAKKYGIDGFCFYHYWFKGKMLLERPVKLLLENENIDIEFCFSWANETWSRRWDGNEKEILIKQEYGNKEDWNNHIKYFLPYFKDKRYIKIDNKPVILLYRAFDIPNCEKMIEFWNQTLVKQGFKGIYIIETLNGFQKKWVLQNSDAYMEFEPMYTLSKNRKYNIPSRGFYHVVNKLKLYDKFEWARRSFDYDKIWRKILNRNHIKGKKYFGGVFPSWDNTARRGNRSTVIKESTPEKFKKYFAEQYRKSVLEEKEFLFINAWNEWGEGAYLEPDEKYRYEYLKAIRDVKNDKDF